MSENRMNEKAGFFNLDDLNPDKGKEVFIEIHPKDAETIRDNYNRFFLTPRIINENGDRIRGFTFSRKDLEMALYGKEQSNPEYLGEIGTDIHISFGYHDGSIDPKVVGYTTVMYGVGIDGLIDVPKRVRDYSRPCPPRCPKKAK